MTFSPNSLQIPAKTTAYLRVSTLDQDLEKNKTAILKLAHSLELGQVHFVEEKISGSVPWRKRKIAMILNSAKKGDNVIVSELSRLSRSFFECLEIIKIALEKEINIYALKGNMRLDNSIQSKAIAFAFSLASEIERDLISQRTKEALQARKQSGKKLGRPVGVGKSKLDEFRPEIEALLNNGSSQKFIANRYKTTPANLNLWLKKHHIK